MSVSLKPWYLRLAKASILVATVTLVAASVGLGAPEAKAQNNDGDYGEAALAVSQMYYCNYIPYLPGFMPGAYGGPYTAASMISPECRYFDVLKARIAEARGTIQMIIVRALSDVLFNFAIQIGQQTATWVLEGMHGEPAFWRKGFKGMLTDLGMEFTNRFIDQLDKQWGLGLCKPITLDMKIALGIGSVVPVPPPDCTFEGVKQNFENMYRQLQPRELAQTLAKSVDIGGNDFDMRLRVNSMYLVGKSEEERAAELDRQETEGMKHVKRGPLNPEIKTPARVINDTLAATNQAELQKGVTFARMNSLALQAMWANLKQLPTVAGMAFLSTVAQGALQKLLDWMMGSDSSEDTNYMMDLSSPYAQKTAEPKKAKARAFTDIIVPNLFSADQLDIVTEMASCPDSRGYWNCTMDEALASAVRMGDRDGALTVWRAAGFGSGGGTSYLNLDWELIPTNEAKDDQDPGCYQRAYCASNLAKMRFARILPIGWELAANSPFNIKNNGKYVTLGAVLRGFNDCNENNKLDAQHPWCHLIDPSWVLTIPPFKCQLKGFGDSLMSPNISMRLQECSDLVSCLKRDDKGVCEGGYGYCLAEKTVWRFGADACDEKYVSCRTYKSRQEGFQKGKELSFIRNSLDYGSCNQDNVGCMFYSTKADTAVTSTLKWTHTATYNGSYVNLGVMPRIYFDSTIQTCDASADGCTKVVRAKLGQPSLNLVRNGSFEDALNNQDAYLDGWYAGLQQTNPAPSNDLFEPEGDISVDGQRSQAFTDLKNISQIVTVSPLRNYALSFYARSAGAGTNIASVTAVLLNSSGNQVPSGGTYYRSVLTCNSVIADSASVGPINNAKANVGATGLTEDWKRFTCEFLSNPEAVSARIIVGARNAAVDGIQLEEGDAPTGFVDGLNGALVPEYIKLPPEEFACTGNTATDRKDCDRFARTCRQTEAGCQGYVEVGGGDQTEIPAIVSLNDYCPASCVGYAEYQKLPSAFDLVRTGATIPANDPLDDPNDETKQVFVPKQSQSCSAIQAGCEEFTNIESVVAGGEEKAYLTYARACQKPNENSQTYFTWEGSETTGYQLRTWSLIKGTTPVFAMGDSSPHYPPSLLEKAGPDGILKNSADCTAATWKEGYDSDCRQFYDELGYAFYAYFSKTIVSSADCRDYRLNESNSDDCTKTGGSYRQNTQDCVYSVLVEESAQCEAINAGCRGYMGTTGRNTAIALQERFTSGSSSQAFYAAGAGTSLSISPEALLVGDYSLRFQGTGSLNIDFPSTTNTLYSLSFWFKSVDPTTKVVTVMLGNDVVGTFRSSLDWRRFELGPFRAKASPTQTLRFVGLPSPAYFDEVTIQRLQDIVYVKKGSWTIPAECDQTTEGIPQPQAMLGCREYRDRNGKSLTLRQFSRLCRYEAVGCSAFIDTRNSDSAYAESFRLDGYNEQNLTKQWDRLYSGTLTVTRPADRFVYVLDEPSTRCQASEMSCKAFGKPSFDAYGVPTSTYETVYLKDDITKYMDAGGEPSMLCRPSELLCDKFVSGPMTSYFRDPRDHVCEWREKVKVAASIQYAYPEAEYSGWFIKGVEPPTPCYPNKQSGGNSFLTEFAAAPNYRGWVNMCPPEQSECTEYRDPHDKSDQAHPQGKPYFFIANEAINTGSCGGKVDPLSGCVLFRNMNDSTLSYNSAATYAKAHSDGDVAVGAINCENDPENEYCTKTGTCIDLRRISCNGSGCEPSEWQSFLSSTAGKTCGTDDDCSHYPAPGANDDFEARGRCQKNDSNLIIKVKLDRDCQTWLGCSSAETVYDPSQQKYIDLCTNLSVCDQLGGAASKNFCGHYVDRKWNNTYSDRVSRFLEGEFYDIGSYIQRQTGLGKPDYSGYSIPNHFQTVDLTMRRVAYEMLISRKGPQRDRLYNDFRLVARAPYTTSNVATDPNRAVPYTDNAYPYLKLCKHLQTGLIGYLAPNDTNYCYLPIEKPYTTVLNEALGQFLGLPGNAQKVSVIFEESEKPNLNTSLNKYYPPVECRAHPESTSPFSNRFVKAWNMFAEPPVPDAFIDGYDGINYCEYGEDCDCSYRKVSYQGRTKYFSAFAGTAPIGMCVGGADEGKACDPDAIISAARQEAEATSAAQASSLAGAIAQQSGAQQVSSPGSQGQRFVPVTCRGGTCAAYEKDTFVRGVVGHCIQRDYSRKLGGTLDMNPCLIWNPSPVLAGQQDRYHYEPTASYMPPASSGEYYCLSKARVPRTNKSQANHQYCIFKFDTPGLISIFDGKIECSSFKDAGLSNRLNLVGTPPGKITHFDYHECYVMDTDVVRDTAMPWGWDTIGYSGPTKDFYERHCGFGATLDGVRANGGEAGKYCSQVRMAYQRGDLPGDIRAGRWVTTGRGVNRQYAEYFVQFDLTAWARWLNNSEQIDWSDEKRRVSALEQNFTSFVFNPWYKTGVGGTWGCGMSGWWTEQFDAGHDGKSWDKAASTIVNKIMAEFKPLTPENFGFLKNENGTKLARLPCIIAGHGDTSGGEEELCYYKYWETGFRADAQPKFRMFWDSMGGSRKLNPADVFFAESEASKPYFAIRAMFEDTSPDDNKISESNMDPSGVQLSGPFMFVGWWVTAAFPGETSERYIYMTMDVNHADICKQVARTSSPTTHETAAFTDRIWESGNFSIPRLGYNYNTEGVPFGGAKHSKPIGKDPLYQLGPQSAGVTFKMAVNRPTFLSSGASYFKAANMPLGNWAYLNNIFAKIYNVYSYHTLPVGKKSWACVAGPNFGTQCPNLSLRTGMVLDFTTGSQVPERDALSRKFCGYSGTCNKEAFDVVNDASAFCNALSGVNAGLACSGSLSLTGYHICHAAPVKNVGGEMKAQYVPCNIAASWTKNPGDSELYSYTGSSATVLSNCNNELLAKGLITTCDVNNLKNLTRKTAAKIGAFKCANNGIKFPDGSPAWCRQPSEGQPSTDCPLEVGPHLAANAWGYSKCNKKTGADYGYCTNGFEHTSCTVDQDCSFWWQTWWYLDMEKSGGQPGKPEPYPLLHASFSDIKNVHRPGPVSWLFNANQRDWRPESDGKFYANYPFKNIKIGVSLGATTAWWHKGAHSSNDGQWAGTDGQVVEKDIGGMSLDGLRYVMFDFWSSPGDLTQTFERFPGIFLMQRTDAADGARVVPAHCEMLPVPANKCKDFVGRLWPGKDDCNGTTAHDVPYFADTNAGARWKGPKNMVFGLCEGGILDGKFCSTHQACRPMFVTDAMEEEARKYCQPVSDSSGNPMVVNTANNTTVAYNCKASSGSPTEIDPDKDDNRCTHGVGYYPRADICGGTLDKDECLTAIKQWDYGTYQGGMNLGQGAQNITDEEALSVSFNLKRYLPPTDVSSGLHVPTYLAEKNNDTRPDAGKIDVDKIAADYGYMAYYAPMPPRVAAPDTARQCASPGQCAISQVGAFSLDGAAEGKLAYVGGQSVNTIRFYAWAADNQMGIRDIWLDWGDGTTQEFHDARMKNRKPICGATKECEFVPGLACNSSGDCPPAAGKCLSTSFCTNKDFVRCTDDRDCMENNVDIGGKCAPRLTFGNSDRACEQNYFEFTHVYLCPKDAKPPTCGTKRYCNRDNTRECVNDAGCALGDKCVVGLAPPGGCFDADSNACRFTPRLIVKDNWGWCTGVCRRDDIGAASRFGGLNILTPYGGCYDGTGLYLNSSPATSFNVSGGNLIDTSGSIPNTSNSCNPASSKSDHRPWVVFQGALQLGVSQ